jgi:recombination protein RecA
MPTASALRLQIERVLESRFPAALSPMPQTVRENAAVGIPGIDSLLSGGLPVGAISEITGASTSGRTSLALSFIAQRTNEGKVCAWVDVSDALDPESAAASGVCLRRLLWVRCTSAAALAKGKPWSRLDQALRAVDLLLQAGGFAATVLDMGDIAGEHGRRVPLATWYRFRQAAEQSRGCLVVLGKMAYAQSSADVVLECAPREAKGRTVLQGYDFDVQVRRQRSATAVAAMRKPPASTWTAPNAWATGAKP